MSSRITARQFTEQDLNRVVTEYDEQCTQAQRYIQTGTDYIQKIVKDVDNAAPISSIFTCCCGYPADKMQYYLDNVLNLKLNAYGSICQGFKKAKTISETLGQLPKKVQPLQSQIPYFSGGRGSKTRILSDQLSTLHNQLEKSHKKVERALSQHFEAVKSYHERLDSAYKKVDKTDDIRWERMQVLRISCLTKIQYNDHTIQVSSGTFKFLAKAMAAKKEDPEFKSGVNQPPVFGSNEEPNVQLPVDVEALAAYLNGVIETVKAGEIDFSALGANSAEVPLLSRASAPSDVEGEIS